MHSFRYRDGRLFCEEVDLAVAAKEFGTPLIYIARARFSIITNDSIRRWEPIDHQNLLCGQSQLQRRDPKVNANAGAGFDIVSGGELYRVIKAGGDPTKCTFAGVGKSREEIEYALRERVLLLQRRERSGARVH